MKIYKSLFNNSIWNLLGVVIPILVAMPALGIISRHLGVHFFGLYTLSFAIIGYASIFDMGMTRSIVRSVSIKMHDRLYVSKVYSTVVLFAIIVSTTAALLIVVFSRPISIHIGSIYSEEIRASLIILSLAIPPLLLSQILLSYFEAKENFKSYNFIRLLHSISLSIFPLICLSADLGLVGPVAGLVIGRFFCLIITIIFVFREFTLDSIKYTHPSFDILKELFKFGGWLTLSNTISPIMVYVDRFILTVGTSGKTIAVYTSPSELVTKMLIVPNAVSKAIFPYLCKNRNKKNEEMETFVFMLVMFSIVSIFSLPFILYSSDILNLWLGGGYGEESSSILKIMLIGFIFTSVSQVPYNKIQAMGFSKLTAYMHIFELIPYIVLLYFMTSIFGLFGAAFSWSARLFFEFLFLSFFYFKKLKKV